MPDIAHSLATGLVDLAVLVPGEPLRFVHPIVRTAIYEDLSAAERADLHARAARLLHEHRADPGAIAVHLLATPPSGDAEVVTMLREAARSALGGGAPDTAAALLRRALDEPPADGDRPLVLFELGNRRARNRGRRTRAVTSERPARPLPIPLLRARAFTALAWTTHPDARHQREQLPLYERAAAEVRGHDRELALQLEAARLGALLLNPDLPAKYEDEADRFADLPAATGAECLLRSFVARSALDAGPIAVAGDLAEQVAAHPALVSRGRASAVAHEHHDLPGRSRALRGRRPHAVACHPPRRAGRLTPVVGEGVVAARSGTTSVRRPAGGGSGRARCGRYPRTDSRLHQDAGTRRGGRFVRRSRTRRRGRGVCSAERGMDGELAPTLFSVLPLLARGRCRAAMGDHARARADLEEALRRIEISRGLFPWASDARVALVPVLCAMGEADAAREVADARLCRRGDCRVAPEDRWSTACPRTLEGGKRRLELLREAAETLASSPALLWRARGVRRPWRRDAR